MPAESRRVARSRRDRTGYREGSLDPATRDALRLASDSIVQAHSDDPAEIVRAVSDFYAALDALLDQDFSAVRLRAIADLRGDGLTYDQIAERTGLSRERIAQLAREAKARHG